MFTNHKLLKRAEVKLFIGLNLLSTAARVSLGAFTYYILISLNNGQDATVHFAGTRIHGPRATKFLLEITYDYVICNCSLC